MLSCYHVYSKRGKILTNIDNTRVYVFVSFRPAGISAVHQWEWERRNDGLLSRRAAARDQQQQQQQPQLTLWVSFQMIKMCRRFTLVSSSYGRCRHRNDVLNRPILHFCVFLSSVPGVSGSSVATGNGSGSILLNFDNEEQTRPSSAGQQQQRLQPLQQQQQQQQQQHSRSSPDVGVYC